MEARVVGRYLLCEEFASGGMASVFLGLLRGDEGFTKAVAIKRLHPQFAKDPEFASALVDEGRMQARVQHPNVCAALDVVRSGSELLLVMEYLHAASLSELCRAARSSGEWPSVPVLSAVLVGTLRGLHAAHEARSVTGAPLDLVHRDVSPQNILVGADGVPRVVDFGIAHAADRSQVTREGVLKGKPSYMAPEQILAQPLTRAADVYAAGVVLWELLTHERLFPGGDFVAVTRAVLDAPIDPPSAVVPTLPPAFDAIVARATAKEPADRFPTAADFADEIERLGPIASAGEVGAWVQRAARDKLAERAELRQRVERDAAAQPHTVVEAPRPSVQPIAIETPDALTLIPVSTHVRPPARRVGAYLAIAGAVVAAALGGAALARDGHPTDAPEARPASEPVASTQPQPAPLAVEPAPVVAVTSAPAATASAAPSPAPSPRPAGTARAAQARPPQDCVIVGADGIKRWNPRCK